MSQAPGRDPDNRVMTVEEVSRLLKIPLSSIYALAQQGKIRAAKIGKHWRFLRSDIETYLCGDRPGYRSHAAEPDPRKHPRIRTSLPAIIQSGLPQESAARLEGTIQNLSAGGLYVRIAPNTFRAAHTGPGSLDFSAGDPVHLSFTVPDLRPGGFELKGRVVRVWVNGRTGLGIKFRQLPPQDEEDLRDYVG